MITKLMIGCMFVICLVSAISAIRTDMTEAYVTWLMHVVAAICGGISMVDYIFRLRRERKK